MPVPIVGQAVPDFSVAAIDPSLDEVNCDIADFTGRWLALIFYPRDFSFVCPTELTDFSKAIEDFKARGCELLAISVDTCDTHRRWLQTPAKNGGVEGLRYPLGADPDGEICRAFGVYRSVDATSNRGLFLIDPDGALRYSVVHDLGVGRNAKDVLRVLDALLAGGLCPANWVGSDGVLDVAGMLQPGRVLGHYRIEREIGTGAFGAVLEAFDMVLNRRVALKVFQKQDEQSSSRLLEEARSAAAIEHPNICRIHAVDEIDSIPTIVMEYVGGRSLLHSGMGKASTGDLRFCVSKIASALAAAHRNGVTHGDLKPSNIVMREANEPVVIDFGLASKGSQKRWKSMTEVDLQNHDPDAATVSLAIPISKGRVSGTPAYMSPEQARGEPLQAPSDIFSLGLICFEWLMGKPPHQGYSPLEILDRLQRQQTIDEISELLPEESRRWIGPMLSLNANDRPTANELYTEMISR
ncbi:MAG: redoxin domain-containing protein [Planctomycetota bacterium]